MYNISWHCLVFGGTEPGIALKCLLYLLKKVKIWSGVTDASQTDTETTDTIHYVEDINVLNIVLSV